jgi:phage virion morphogenesis protein
MIKLRVQLEPAVQLLATLSGRLAAPAELLAPTVPLVAHAIERNFDEEGRPLRWPPLAPATLRRKPAGLRILERTGRLRRSIQTRLEGNAVVASTDLPYAAPHQFGFPRRRLPARPFLVLTETDKQEIALTIADSLEISDHRSPNTGHSL